VSEGLLMNTYRVYLLSRTDQIIDARMLRHETDDEAIRSAEQLAEPYPLEVWEGRRKVARLEPPEQRNQFELAGSRWHSSFEQTARPG
jgi:hypothetical protein